MHYKKRLLTGVAICQACGATWEVFRIREEEATCEECGAQLKLIDEDDYEIPVKGAAY